MARRPDWQDLNAYVDGELDPAAAADVAARFGQDGALTAQVSALARLKAASAAALAVDPADVPTVALRPAAGRWRLARGPVLYRALAAAVALVVVLAALALWRGEARPGLAEAWLAAAAARHGAWLTADVRPAPMANPNLVLADAGGFGGVPDLAVARLAVAHVAVDASSRQPGLFVGYVGTKGCRLSLWIGPAPEALPVALTEHRDAAVRSFTWRVEDTGYAVMASGMDEARFAATAAYLERQTRRDAEREREVRIAAARTEAVAAARCTG